MKKYFYSLITYIGFVLICIISLNYYMDIYGVLRMDSLEKKTPINERYLKTKYIIENKEKYDSFIFGSSRVGTLKGEKLKFGKFYNMTFSAALPKEILDILKIFKDNNVKIKNIVLGIDDFHLYTTPESQNGIMYKLSYEELSKNKFKIYEKYLLINPFNKLSYEHFFGDKVTNFDILETGKWSLPFKEEEIRKNMEKHIQNKIFEIPYSNINNKSRLDETLQEIKSIIKFCKEENIKLTVIFLPLHKTTYENNDLKNLELFKCELSKITSYWDFATINKYTTNNSYWYETSHYRPILGELIFKKIFKNDFDLNIELEDKENIFGIYKSKF